MTIKDEVKAAEREVNDNYKYFKKMLPEWRDDHLSEHALIHRQELVMFFQTTHDAIQVGIKDYGLGNFSVQSIRHTPADFGHQSNAIF
ncbi:hypothetical protein [Candidatus Spongiihabitans sp.]|uniref:hypothetical protein n=1 Tax=Candidatus Spongiihabitans sp. TaxID=3101308 RepID=UPI003C7B33EB